MKKTEFVLIIIAIIALVFNLLFIPGGEVLTVLSFSALSILYMHLGFALFNEVHLRNIFKKEAYKGISVIRIIGAILTGFALAMTIVGILFKLQLWSGSSTNLTVGLTGLVIISITVIIKYFKTKADYFSKILYRITIFGGLGLLLLILPEETWLELKYRNHQSYVEAFKKANANPGDQELWNKVKEERRKIR